MSPSARRRPHGPIVPGGRPAGRTPALSANRSPGRLAERPGRPLAGARRARGRREQRRGARAGPEGPSDRVAAPRGRAQGDGAAACPGPALKASSLLARSEAAPGDPGGGAARRPRRPVRARPPSAANPTPRSAQRAAGRRALTSRRGGAAGGAGARGAAPALKGPPAPRAHRACPTAGRGGTGRRRAHARAARRSHGWRPRGGGGAALVHESAPAGSRQARGAFTGPRRRTFRRSRAAGRAGPALRRGCGWPRRSFRASWTKCCPRGDRAVGARALGAMRAGLCLCVSCAPAQVGNPRQEPLGPCAPGPRVPLFPVRGLAPPCWADNRPFSQWPRGSRGGLFGDANGTFSGPLS